MKIAVFGDVMLDRYIIGSVDRISPEAPVPILKVKEEKYMPGGCANVAANVSTLGSEAYLFGYTGDDSAKKKLFKELDIYNINYDNVWPALNITTQKTRIISNQQQLLRIDNEESKKANHIDHNTLVKISLEGEKYDVIIISDYAKGFINEYMIAIIKEYAMKNNVPIIIDPKPANMNLYKDVYLITPNKREAEQMCGIKIHSNDDIEYCGRKLKKELNSNIIITLGNEGMMLFKDDEKIHLPTKAREVYDVSGAGDTVVAAIALSLSHGNTLEKAAQIANVAAGIKVGKHGTAPILLSELKEKQKINW